MTTKLAPRIVLLDDDAEFRQLLSDYLTADRFDVLATGDVDAGLEEALSGRCQIMLLDVMLANTNGFDVLRTLRGRSDLPVIMLTARGDDLDRILGLELGADDYVAKPFHPRELAARIRAVMRRATPSDERPAPALIVGDLRLDFGARRVSRDGQTIPLTGVEFSLLEVLVRSAGRLVTREDLFRRVLDRRLVPFDRSIDMHVSNLRRKLGDRIGDVERIQALRGVGYIYASVDSATL